MSDDLKIRMPEWARHMYNRLVALIDAGGGGEENVIESISMNGVNVPPDANKNVALAESDPTVPSWAKQNSKPAYTASEVGAIPTTQKGAAGGVAELDSSGKVPSSQLPPGGEENVIEAISFNGSNIPPDANKRVSMTETDPTVPSWAKATTKPSYTAQEVGALPTGNYNMSVTQTGGLNRVFAGVDITQADNGIPGTIKQGQLLTAMDANSRRFFVIRSIVDGNGDIEFRLGCYNHDGTDTIGVYGYVVISKAGTVTFTFSHPDEIRQALDIIEATTTQAGLMSAADKTKLDGIAPGGGDVTGVKGDAESSYRTGQVNLTAANIGAQADVGFYIDAQGYLCQRIGSD